MQNGKVQREEPLLGLNWTVAHMFHMVHRGMQKGFVPQDVSENSKGFFEEISSLSCEERRTQKVLNWKGHCELLCAMGNLLYID